ncbi:MAG: BamA/TamA family outer membrane protein [Tannerellaceae bacterium]|nr:BamA/TamA family outer membrane protein [Tannerellaceae bacterium]
MKYHKRPFIYLCLCLFFTGIRTVKGQEIIHAHVTDTILPSYLTYEQTNKQKQPRNLQYSILGGPSYTPDYGLLLGGSALLTFRMNARDTTHMRSVVPLAFAVMFKGGFNLVIRPQLFFKDDRFRIFGQFKYKNTLDNYYGVGYSTNKNYKRGKETSEFRYSQFQVNPWFLFRIKDSDFFAGPQFDLNYDKFKDPAEGIIHDPSYRADGGTAEGYRNLSSGIGFLVTYDTRDIPANAYGGIYLDAKGLWYNKVIGSDNNFYKLELEYRQYQLVGKRKVLAWTVQSKHGFGDIPINKYTLTGTPFDLRGYYMGQYRDRSSHVLLAEYRQMVNTDGSLKVKRLLNRLGYAVWGGSGFMGPTPGKIEGVLPNAGLGLRIEVQPRMNVRVDVGHNFRNGGTLFYMNMTEAF